MEIIVMIILLLAGGCSSREREEAPQGKKAAEVIEGEVNYTGRTPENSIGLALSGGGVRSASFNIGVMGGLASAGILEEVDYISSVSGGSYAAYWYYTKLKWNMDEEEHFFRMRYDEDEGAPYYRFQEHLRNNMKMGRYGSESSDGPVDKIKTAGAVSWRVLYAIPFAAAEIFQVSRIMGKNYSPVTDYYRNSIERIYGFYPGESNTDPSLREGEYLNRGELPWRLESFGFQELGELYRGEKRVPIWIINTTADVNNSWPRWRNAWREAPELNKSVFEFTPFYYGNSWYGHHKTTGLEEEISHYIQTSGAALDSANHYNVKAGGILLSPISMGNYVEAGGGRLYLTDGGHSENLAAYALIRRGVGKIIISDAEYGLGGKLTGLIRLLDKLEDEYTFEFEDERFDEYLKRWRAISPGERRKRRTAEENPLPTPLPQVLRGRLRERSGDREIEIYYVKLKMAKKQIRSSGDEWSYSEELLNKIPVIARGEGEKFPYNSTLNMWYTAEQYQSYFALGEYLGRVTGSLVGEKETGGVQLQQESRP